MAASGKFLDTTGLVYFYNNKIKNKFTTLGTNQTVTGLKTIKNQLKVQYGNSGGIVLGADSSNTTLTNDTLKLGSIVSPMFSSASKTFTVLQSRGEGDVNIVSVGGTAAGTNPTIFQVALDNSIGGKKTRDVLLANYNGISIGVNTINLLSPDEGNVTFSRGASSLSFVGHSLVFTGAGFTYSNGEEGELTIGSAGSTTVLPSADPEDESPVWRLGNSARRFKQIYVDEIHSNADGHDTSIKSEFSAFGPGYRTDHITASTLLLDGHNNAHSPVIAFSDIVLGHISYEDSYFGNSELHIGGDLSAKNARVDYAMHAGWIYAEEVATPALCISGDTTDHFFAPLVDNVVDSENECVELRSDGGLRVNRLHTYDLHMINSSDDSSFYMYAQTDVDDPMSGNVLFIEDASLNVNGIIKEGGTALEDKYALKGDIALPDNVVTEEYVDNVANGLYENISYEISQEVKDVEKMSNNYIGHPEGGDYRYLNQITGAICIKVPRLAKKGIISFTVTVANSRQYSFAEYKICGYQSGAANWYNWSAICITSALNETDVNSHKLYNLPVKYAFNTSTNEYYIYIGELTTQFSYPVVTINNVTFNAFSNDEVNKLRSGWQVSIVSSYPVPVNNTFSTAIYTPKQNYTLDEIGSPNSSINAPFTVQPFMGATRAMRLFALPTDQIIVEQSVDGGATWSSANVEDWTKQQIFSQTRLGSIPIPLKSGKKSCSCMVRVTITGMKYNVPAATVETQKYNYWNSNYVLSNERYCTLDFGYFWISANYDKMYIEHQVSTGAYPNDWIVDGNLNKAQGWTGGDYVKFSGNAFGGGTTQIYNYWNHRFIFRTQASDGSFDDSKLNQDGLTTQQTITEISCYGQNCWTAANEMMKSDRPYTVNNSNQTTFTGDVVVQGAMYPQGYVMPQNDVYGQASIYAKKGFIFTDQQDADQKLLRADGWWQHVNTFARSYTKYNLYNTDKYTQVISGDTTTITLNEEYGYYYIDLAMLQFPNIVPSAYCTVIIKSNYPNTKCVVYTDPYAQRYNVIVLLAYAQNGYVFPTTNPINAGYITTLVNNPYDLTNNYVEFENDSMVNTKYLLEWTEQGDCKVMWTSDM